MICQHCGAELPSIAMFCGECGRSVSARSAVPPVEARPAQPVSARVDLTNDDESVEDRGAEPQPLPDAEPHVVSVLEPEAEVDPEAAESGGMSCTQCGTPALFGDRYCAECGYPLRDGAVSLAPSEPVAVESTPIASAEMLAREENPESFVLQFSTGDSYTVVGSGLAGRNPRPEPGEVVDHLVTIVDRGRSVSKTHFEFGQTDGAFWISDRHSGNGTVIREPGAEPRVCEPGRRYVIARGTRVDLGEQYVLLS